MPNLLLEIGVEELPASYIKPAQKAFVHLLEDFLPVLRNCIPRMFATPRRLAFFWENLPAKLPSVEKELRGPTKKAAFDDNNMPTRALEGFLKRCGCSADAVILREEKGKEYCYVRLTEEGRSMSSLIAEAVPKSLDKLTFPKNMRWKEQAKTFARPIRHILCLLGEKVCEFEWNGVVSGNFTRGHSILAPAAIVLRSANIAEYCNLLEKSLVVVDDTKRKRLFETRMSELSASKGYLYIRDDALLDEVINQLEWPNAVIGSLEEKYLELPPPVLAETLKHHQFSFLLFRKNGEPAPAFVFACNLRGDSATLAKVREGNENVCRARLEDAWFFYQEDLKTKLSDRREGLKDVVFHPKLGNYLEKTERVASLTSSISIGSYGERRLPEANINDPVNAAQIARVDLLTNMVFELPKLQGTIGRYYALENGESPEVATAIEEMYMPVAKGAKIPSTASGTILALADRLDTLAGFFIAGMKPTSSKDPFGLRRQAIAIISILKRNGIIKSLLSCFREAARGYTGLTGLLTVDKATEDFSVFFLERLRQEMLEEAPYDLCEAVFDVTKKKAAGQFDANSANDIDVQNTFVRLEALRKMAKNPEFSMLCTSLERAANITRDMDLNNGINETLFREPLEKELHRVYESNREYICSEISKRTVGGYKDAAQRYVEVFPGPLHEFFEKVYVNAEDENLRNNRKALLKAIYLLLAKDFADLTLVVKNKSR